VPLPHDRDVLLECIQFLHAVVHGKEDDWPWSVEYVEWLLLESVLEYPVREQRPHAEEELGDVTIMFL